MTSIHLAGLTYLFAAFLSTSSPGSFEKQLVPNKNSEMAGILTTNIGSNGTIQIVIQQF
jgi:hypothetical protein